MAFLALLQKFSSSSGSEMILSEQFLFHLMSFVSEMLVSLFIYI